MGSLQSIGSNCRQWGNAQNAVNEVWGLMCADVASESSDAYLLKVRLRMRVVIGNLLLKVGMSSGSVSAESVKKLQERFQKAFLDLEQRLQEVQRGLDG